MKSIKILPILLFLSTVYFSYAQITPIETIVDTKKTIYYTNLYSQKIITYKNQSYDLKQKIQENIKIIDNTSNPLFVKDCLDTATYTNLRKNKIIFIIEYISNQNGDVVACKLINYRNKVSLSNDEVECILTKAMENKFSFSNIPSTTNNFYMLINKSFKFK